MKPRNSTEKKLLDEVEGFHQAVQQRIIDRHTELDNLKLEQRIAYQNRLQTQGVEGGRMLEFIRHMGGFVDPKKVRCDE